MTFEERWAMEEIREERANKAWEVRQKRGLIVASVALFMVLVAIALAVMALLAM
ncbi:hypothetical protein LCGC14_2860300 [marine sediment metagenome]|uniref:Uncharacterized protein n=1 Tax=marine sediment metagenome TaxID=412755 RepID=A0A0F9AWX4_9ZZZZ